MKKWTATLLVVLLLLIQTGCGSNLKIEGANSQQIKAIQEVLDDTGIKVSTCKKATISEENGFAAVLAAVYEPYDVVDEDGTSYRMTINADDKTVFTIVRESDGEFVYGSLFGNSGSEEEPSDASNLDASSQSDVSSEAEEIIDPLPLTTNELLENYHCFSWAKEKEPISSIVVQDGKFSHTFSTGTILNGTVDENNNVVDLTLISSAQAADKEALIKEMEIASSVANAVIMAQNDVDQFEHKLTLVLNQLKVTGITAETAAEISERFLGGEQFSSVCDGVLFTRQCDPESSLSYIKIRMADIGQEDTVD